MMTGSDPFKQAWQAEGGDAPLPRLDDIRAGAGAFYRRIRRRNLIEYAAAAIAIPFFAFTALTTPDSSARIGAILVVLGMLFVVWQLHRRASAVAPAGDAALPLIAHQRAQLVRQRDALASIGTWYLLPLVPGLAVIALSPLIDGGWAAFRGLHWFHYAWVAISTAFFLFLWWLNRAAARLLQTEIDALDALEGDTQ